MNSACDLRIDELGNAYSLTEGLPWGSDYSFNKSMD